MNEVESIKNIAKVVSSWWSDVIMHPKMDNGDESEAGILSMALLTMMSLDNITVEQQKQFRNELYEFIVKTLQNADDTKVLWLDVDYSPNKYLSDIAKSCNISSNNFPLKTTMKITKHFVSVRYGYGSDFETLYADKHYYMQKIQDYKETIKHYEIQDDSYFFIGSKESNIKRCENEIKKCEIKIKELETNGL